MFFQVCNFLLLIDYRQKIYHGDTKSEGDLLRSSLCILVESTEGLEDSGVTGEDLQDKQEAETKAGTPKQSTAGFTLLGGFENKPVLKVQS